MLPCVGAWVSDPTTPDSVGEVRAVRGTEAEPIIDVCWHRHSAKRGQSSEHPDNLVAGFMLGMHVEHVPVFPGSSGLGYGEVASVRELGGHSQVLVDFWESGQRLWLPYQHLRMLRGVEQRFRQGRLGNTGDAERFRLRCLAHALEIWNENTGALSHFDIDPLPHQIHLVHRILSSGHLNWMIADDVGLGKTIEVGMLLSALRQRNQCRRILLITPPGLTVQWQEELAQKFRIDDFEVYGRDFEITDVRRWKMHDHVIASIDRLKQEEHLQQLLQGERWDLVVFDEAHRLSRRQYGLKLDYSQRYALAAKLRHHCEHMLLLTATPHQGMSDKFTALLELVRPDLRDQLHLLDLQPKILGEIIIRNRKDHVTDADGKLIFKGKQTHAIPVPVSDQAKEFDKELQDYLRRGEQAVAQAKGKRRYAIGFVMNVYRKLAASSAAAIHQALKRRRERLKQEFADNWDDSTLSNLMETDARYEGENEESLADGAAKEFFDGELALVDEMISKAELLLEHDAKLQAFVEKMVALIHAQDSTEKILIFTEYRSTQSYLKKALERQLGAGCVELIHGGQNHDERRAAIQRFEDAGRFLISTEAGGEGINLQRHCHILVNYDLPWNPMRLVQRIGRLYRYGQQRPVLVFNMHAPETLDGKIVELLYTRLEQVVQDMATVSSEFRAGLEDEVFGQMAELIDVEDILQAAGKVGVTRTEQEIEEAIRKARSAAELQQDLFQYVSGYERDDANGELRMGADHLRAFAEGMFNILGVKEIRSTHNGLLHEIELPESLQHELPGWKAKVRLTFDRSWGVSRNDVHVLDLESPLTRMLLTKAKEHRFSGLFAQVAGLPGNAVVANILRWQNTRGIRMRQEFGALQLFSDGRSQRNSEDFSRWLLEPATDGSRSHDKEQAEALVKLATAVSDKRFQGVSEGELQPENRQWLAAGWLS
jgi:superfamily II DNA or RNA helicase